MLVSLISNCWTCLLWNAMPLSAMRCVAMTESLLWKVSRLMNALRVVGHGSGCNRAVLHWRQMRSTCLKLRVKPLPLHLKTRFRDWLWYYGILSLPISNQPVILWVDLHSPCSDVHHRWERPTLSQWIPSLALKVVLEAIKDHPSSPENYVAIGPCDVFSL